MKKAFLLLCMAAGMMGCAKEALVPENENTQKEGVPMTFNVTVLETKAVKDAWADGDKIYVFFNGLETKYLIMERSSGVWTGTSGGGTLLDTDFSGLGTKTVTAVHFPVAVDVAYADSKFSFTSGGEPVYNYYLYETGKSYTISGTTVTASLSLGKPAGMAQFHIEGIHGNVSDYTFGCSKVRPVACASVGTDGAITEDVLQAGARLSGVADSDGGIFAGRLVYPGAAKDYTFTVASNDNIYTLTRDGKTLTAGTMYNFPALSETGGSNWGVTDASDLIVDLGITVGGKTIYWAKCNLGATTETDYGDYFAWGEITGYNEGKTKFAWSTYAWGTTNITLTKYCNDSGFGSGGFTDALTTLLPEDDAAYAALGGKFRMPTPPEIEALLALSKEWVTDYNGSGINGYTFTGNGNTIFLPAPGHRNGSSLFSAGSYGYYWSSFLDTSSTDFSWYLHLGSDELADFSTYRCLGLSVRPVSE